MHALGEVGAAIVGVVPGLHGWHLYLVVGALAFGEAAAFVGLVLPGELATFVGGALVALGRWVSVLRAPVPSPAGAAGMP